MPLHFFRITDCDGCSSEHPAEISDNISAWTETAMVFGDLARGLDRYLKENAEWQLELLGAGKEPLYRIRLVSETCDAVASTDRLTAGSGNVS